MRYGNVDAIVSDTYTNDNTDFDRYTSLAGARMRYSDLVNMLRKLADDIEDRADVVTVNTLSQHCPSYVDAERTVHSGCTCRKQGDWTHIAIDLEYSIPRQLEESALYQQILKHQLEAAKQDRFIDYAQAYKEVTGDELDVDMIGKARNRNAD